MDADKRIRVLIVDDTLVGQRLLKGILSEDSRFEVIGFASNGEQAVDFVAKFSPDVVSMDIFMPVMDGVESTRKIMENTPVPIVIVSSLYNSSETRMSFSILEAGALTILPRPFGPGHPQYYQTARHYRNILKLMSEVKVMKRYPGAKPTKIKVDNPSIPIQNKVSVVQVIAIGASAGGPAAISTILNKLPNHIPAPVLIVQHIDSHFADSYCEWLNTSSSLPVHIAKDNEYMLMGHVYLPPGDHHLELKREGIIAITQNKPEKGLRPAVSALFRSVLEVYGSNSICILLAGMGADGAKELKILRDAGALTIAQDAQSSLVHGMPGEAIRLGAAVKILSPEEIAEEIKNTLFKKSL